MTVYYTLTFWLLASEMVAFCILVAPLPHRIRKAIFRAFSNSPLTAQITHALKIAIVFVAVLFVDAFQRMQRIHAEAEAEKSAGHHHHEARAQSDIFARKFHAERNTYLTGFTLFLSFVLVCTGSVILDLVHTKEENAKLKADAKKGVEPTKEQAKSGIETVRKR